MGQNGLGMNGILTQKVGQNTLGINEGLTQILGHTSLGINGGYPIKRVKTAWGLGPLFGLMPR